MNDCKTTNLDYYEESSDRVSYHAKTELNICEIFRCGYMAGNWSRFSNTKLAAVQYFQ